MALWIVAAVGVAAVSLVVDYVFEPSRGARTALLIGYALFLVWLLARWVLSPFFVRWSPSSVAAALERRLPAMNERLVTAVELAEFPPAPALLERVNQEAADLAREVLPTALLSIRSTLRLIMLAMLSGVVVAVVAVANADFVRTWWRRAVLLEPLRYRRETSLTLEGFTGSVRKVGRGRDVDVVVKTSGRVPARAVLELLNARTSQRRHVMSAAGGGEFRHRFRTVVQPIEFAVGAGDERTDALRLEPVDPPGVRSVETTIEPPSYTGQSTKSAAWTSGPVNAPVGSQVRVQLTFDQPIASLDAKLAGRMVDLAGSVQDCEIAWEVIETKRLTVRYVNQDGVDGDEPFSLDVVAVPDRLPVFEKFEPSNVGPAVTRLAALPFSTTLTDDYGVEEAAFVLTTPNGKRLRVPLAEPPVGAAGMKPALELGPLGFKEGDKFTLTMEASDLPQPHPFLGERWSSLWPTRTVRAPAVTFEVVASDELQARLAARELNDRLRFEQTLRECRDARRTLAEAAAAKEAAPTLQRLRVEEALQTIRKTANETRELSAGFFGLVEEFRNNRVGASGMLERLERSVAEPLQKLADDSFTARIHQIQSASTALGSPAFPKAAGEAVQGLDGLVHEGEAILAAMRKMENFNELIAALRTLRDEQNKLLQETKEERKRRILDLVK